MRWTAIVPIVRVRLAVKFRKVRRCRMITTLIRVVLDPLRRLIGGRRVVPGRFVNEPTMSPPVW